MMQEHEPEQQQEQPMPFFNKPMADDSLGSLQYQLDNYDIIEDVIHDLKKEVQVVNREGRVIWQAKPNTQALINEQGLGNIISTLKSRLNKIISLSDLPDEVINRIVHDIHEDLTDDFYYNFEIYQIKDIATASMIISLVTDTVYSTLRKGYLGNYMKLLRSMHSIQEIQQGHIRPNISQQVPQSMSDKIGGMLFRKRR